MPARCNGTAIWWRWTSYRSKPSGACWAGQADCPPISNLNRKRSGSGRMPRPWRTRRFDRSSRAQAGRTSGTEPRTTNDQSMPEQTEKPSDSELLAVRASGITINSRPDGQLEIYISKRLYEWIARPIGRHYEVIVIT